MERRRRKCVFFDGAMDPEIELSWKAGKKS
jgi:hypothetical protein